MTDRGGWGGKSPHLPVLWDIWDRVGLGWDDGHGDSAMYGWWLGASIEGGTNGGTNSADPSKHDAQRTRDERVVLPTHKGQVTKRIPLRCVQNRLTCEAFLGQILNEILNPIANHIPNLIPQ